MINNVFVDNPPNPATKAKNQETFYDPIMQTLCERAVSNRNSTLVVVGPPKSGKVSEGPNNLRTTVNTLNMLTNLSRMPQSYTLHCTPTSPTSEDNFSCPTQVSSDDGSLKSSHSGLLPHLICSLFSKAKNDSSLRHACLTLSICQVYNEQITDLLALKQPGPRLTLMHSKTMGSYVDGLTSHACKSAKFAVELYEQAMAIHAWLVGVEKRRLASGATILVELGIAHEVGGERTLGGTVKVAEVGGFEGAPETLDVGDRLNKQSHVGKGFESLKKVLTHLGQSDTVPNYRMSTLTYLLRDGLGGKDDKSLTDPRELLKNHKTIFVGCLSPMSDQHVASVSLIKALDKAEDYDPKLKEKVEKFEEKVRVKESRGSERVARNSSRVSMRRSVGPGAIANIAAEFFVPQNFVKDIEEEIEEVEERERARVVEEREREKREKEEEEAEKVRLGIIKPKKKQAKFLEKLKTGLEDGDEGEGDEDPR